MKRWLRDNAATLMGWLFAVGTALWVAGHHLGRVEQHLEQIASSLKDTASLARANREDLNSVKSTVSRLEKAADDMEARARAMERSTTRLETLLSTLIAKEVP